MARLFANMVSERPTSTALVDERSALSWADLNRRVNRWIHVFRAHGLGTGDRVGFVMGNRNETFEALFACLHAGLVVVPISWRLTAVEIGYVLADSGSRGLIADPDYAEAAARAADSSGTLGMRLVTGDRPRHGLVPVAPLLDDAGDAEPDGQCSGDVLLYTSGTTGRPKGVVTGRFVAGAPLDRTMKLLDLLGAGLGIPDQGRVLLVAPWYHSGQLFFSMFPLLRGCTLVLRHGFDPVDTLATIDNERITMGHFVPTQFIRLLRVDEQARSRFRGASLERVWHGGGPCPIAVKQAMINWWGEVLVEYYAGTEAGIATLIDSATWLSRPGSVGRALAPNEIVIAGADGESLPPGVPGTVYLRQPPGRDFSYYNAPEKTAAAHLGPGVFTLGDIGHLDEDGFLYLTGRSLDTIVSGGVNIYATEIELVLQQHPAVRDVAVFGVPDAEFGEQVKAVIAMEQDAGVAPDGLGQVLDSYCRSVLAGYKVPRSYDIVDALPREPTGKLFRSRIRDAYWTTAGQGA
jgi:acyl-CoA synthetase (AMP-forming)/AMP-acid ligase II